MEFIGKGIATIAVSLMIIGVAKFVPEYTIWAIGGGLFMSLGIWGD